MIHKTALVDCAVPESAKIGPYAVVGNEVTLGENVVIGAHAVVVGITTLAEGVQVGPGAVIGTPPQDLKYAGERTTLEIGAGTVIREMANINCGTSATGRTVIGAGCFLMAFSHVAHDCVIGDGVILANSVNLAGHVEVGTRAIIGGVVPVHQFTRIGEYSMIGGATGSPWMSHPSLSPGENPSVRWGSTRSAFEGTASPTRRSTPPPTPSISSSSRAVPPWPRRLRKPSHPAIRTPWEGASPSS